MARLSKQGRAKQAHRRLAAFLCLFLALHFAAHIAALDGVGAQNAVMRAGRLIYRHPVIEPLLILGFACQIALGVMLLKTIGHRKRRDFWHYAQFISGVVMVAFIIAHISAALMARWIGGIDTNFYWPAGTLIIAPLKYGFMPYYAAAVVALVTHLIAALHFRGARRWHGPALIAGPVLAAAILLAYSGALYRVELPAPYREYFTDQLDLFGMTPHIGVNFGIVT